MTSITIRPATLDDSDAIAAVHHEALKYYNEFYAAFFERHPRDLIPIATRSALQNPSQHFLVAEAGESVAGFVRYRVVKPNSNASEHQQPPTSWVWTVKKHLEDMWEEFNARGKDMDACKEEAVDGNDYFEVMHLMVHPLHQRKGIGGWLLASVTEQADETNAPTLIVSSREGFGLYKKHGFASLDTFPIDNEYWARRITQYEEKIGYTEGDRQLLEKCRGMREVEDGMIRHPESRRLKILDPYVFDHAYAYAFPQQPHQQHTTPYGNSTAYASSTKNFDDEYSLNFGSSLPRDDIYRQSASILFIAGFGAAAIYVISAALSYYFVFDRRLEYHPRFLKNQIKQEIQSSFYAIPIIDLLTLPFFLGEVRGHSLLYTRVDEYGWWWLGVSTIFYMVFNDIGIYWIHRLEHHPSVYKYVHKPHHKWIIPTPWAAIAFHPVDGYLQSLPYHVFVYICPMQKHLYMFLFVCVQIWTILIHDGDMITGHWLEKFINSPAHHTLHHMFFTCNYGQYFTWADNYWDSHRAPMPELDPIHEALKVMREKGLVDKDGNPISKTKEE
ncbi:hypothetical protein F66182_6250 [Fusarium sp. NRRL 66182]|nr:hypothetical protein F66182_6250 [Fusarium sp. NRRL 66182]